VQAAAQLDGLGVGVQRLDQLLRVGHEVREAGLVREQLGDDRLLLACAPLGGFAAQPFADVARDHEQLGETLVVEHLPELELERLRAADQTLRELLERDIPWQYALPEAIEGHIELEPQRRVVGREVFGDGHA
jgi:hypothetical protein